jgi:tetrahydromethanopterin S-methyltransferase subunit D
VTLDFAAHNAVLLATQAALVGLTGAGIPARLQRYATARWALVLPLSIAVVVAAIALLPDVADVLTWVALILVPPGAALALGWAMRGARPPLALLAAPLLALAWTWQTSAAGELAGTALTALSCVTLGRLLAGAAPGPWLKAGIVAMAVIDAILVFSNGLEQPNAVLNAAVPAPGLPQLQYVSFGPASLGYGDLFVAGVLGGVLGAEGARTWPWALVTWVLAEAFTLLFYVTDTLPMTVPVAVVVLVREALRAQPHALRRQVAHGAGP